MLKKVIMIVLVIILLGLVCVLGFLVYLNFFVQPIPLFVEESTPRTVIDGSSYSSVLQFFPNLRFASKNITYSIDDSCSAQKVKNMEDSFLFLEERTYLRFNEVDSNPGISIICDEYTEPIEGGTQLIAGEGGPTKIINTSLFYIIEKGEIYLFYNENNCNNFNIEIHELLHVLGFDHSDKTDSIMYTLSSCNQAVTIDIIVEINRVYSFNELPEIIISSVEAVKHGMYIDMDVEIRNIGLKTSKDVEIEIYEGNKMINSFKVNPIDYGEGKILTLTNLYVGIGMDKLRVRAVSPNQLSGNNPEVEMSIE